MEYSTLIVAVFAAVGIQMATTVNSSHKGVPYYDAQNAMFVNASDSELAVDAPTPVAHAPYPMPDPNTGRKHVILNGQVLPISDEAAKLIQKDAAKQLKQIAHASRPFYQRWASNVKWVVRVLWKGYSHPTSAGTHIIPHYVILLWMAVGGAQLYRYYCVQVCSETAVVYRACGMCKRYDATAANARWRRLVLATASNQGRFVYNQLSGLCLIASFFMCSFKPHPVEAVGYGTLLWNYISSGVQMAVNYNWLVSNPMAGTFGSAFCLQLLNAFFKHLFNCDCGCCCRKRAESEDTTSVQNSAAAPPKPSMPIASAPPMPQPTNTAVVAAVDHSREGESHDSDHDDEKEGEGEFADAVDHEAYPPGLLRDGSVESMVKYMEIAKFFSDPNNKRLLREKSRELTDPVSRHTRAMDRYMSVLQAENPGLARRASSFFK